MRSTMFEYAQRLTTPFSVGRVPFSEYPRPQLVRDSYYCLNGEWRLSCQTADRTEFVGEIMVPFPPESSLSGIEKTLDKTEMWVYEREFMLPDGFVNGRVLLHFGAVDQAATVFVNDREIGSHTGGYLPFSFDITDALEKDVNRLRVVVSDPLDADLPYGKQRRKRGGMWYTPVSGIWQTVWLESVPTAYIERLVITPSLDRVTVRVCGGVSPHRLTIHDEGGDRVYEFDGDSITVVVENPHLWTPESPYLYS
ncbi:MAG: glycoside hydrolase family 2, partial [Clostridia bacterium]|nr:glycoside hydrolase family 2 [Clostridia bacterium]